MKLLFTLIAVVLSSGLDEAQSELLENVSSLQPVDFYDCTGQYDGHYEHPKKCSSYIVCQNQKAYEKDCEACDSAGPSCPGGILHFDANLRRCDFPDPDRAGCGTSPTRPTTTTTTTPRPEVSCPRNCSQTGDCIYFWNCEPEGDWAWDDATQTHWGIWTNNTCGKNLFWHPTEEAPGGFCDFFENLPKEIQIKYKKDEECFCPCYWEPHETKEGRCEGKYYYWNRVNENDHDLIRQELKCPDKLYFNWYSNTCDHCENVNEGECCPR